MPFSEYSYSVLIENYVFDSSRTTSGCDLQGQGTLPHSEETTIGVCLISTPGVPGEDQAHILPEVIRSRKSKKDIQGSGQKKKGQTINHKTLHRNQTIEQHEPY